MKKSKKFSSNKPLIGFDMDGVIIDQTLPKINLAKKYGFIINSNQAPSEIIKTIIPDDIWKKIQNHLYLESEFALSAPLMDGVKSTLQTFKRKQIPYVLISRRKNPLIAIQLLEGHDLWPDFFGKENTFFVSNPEDKNIEARKLGVTHYIDDERRVLKKLASVPNRYLFDRFQVFGDADFYKRIGSWEEIGNFF